MTYKNFLNEQIKTIAHKINEKRATEHDKKEYQKMYIAWALRD